MLIDIITLFPEMFKGPFDESIVKKAQEKKLVKINIHNLRKWGIDKRGTVDDRPYGGGTGMLLRPEPIDAALRELKAQGSRASAVSSAEPLKAAKKNSQPKADLDQRPMGLWPTPLAEKIILLSPAGKVFNQKMAQKFAKLKWLTLVCGHYEGVDYRVHQYLVDETVSIGDYILTGGEIPAMVIVDSIVRLIPNVLDKNATKNESFSLNCSISKLPAGRQARLNYSSKVKLLEFPQYTRPENFKGHKVPKILLSGNHKEIEKWRQKQALSRTRQLRPDLLQSE